MLPRLLPTYTTFFTRWPKKKYKQLEIFSGTLYILKYLYKRSIFIEYSEKEIALIIIIISKCAINLARYNAYVYKYMSEDMYVRSYMSVLMYDDAPSLW